MTLRSNASSIGFGISVPFAATGGVAPYAYSVEPGGVGGSIDPVTGLYTAPRAQGIDTVKVTDDNSDTQILNISIFSALGLLCDVIKTELELEQDQVYIYNSKFTIPNDRRMYVAVQVGDAKPYSNINRSVASGGALMSEQSANFKSLHEINIMSRDEAALSRKEEVLLAFNSNYAKNQQALNSFYIAPLANQFNNLSEVDGSAIPYRFNISVYLQYMIKKIKPVAHYDTFLDPTIIIDP